VYDTETGLYYLQTRYYDPAIGRFICTDGYASTGQGLLGTNMFAYCNNNPVNMVDSNGEEAIAIVAVATIGGLFCVAAFAVTYVSSTEAKIGWKGFCKGLSDTLSDLKDTVVDTFNKCSIVLAPTVNQITSKTVNEDVQRRLVKVNVASKNYRTPTELHHIVAKNAVAARYARNILKKLGISINGVHNTVLLRTEVHRRLHTEIYYIWVNATIGGAYASAYGVDSLQRNNVIAALWYMKLALQAM
jgi:RHS repeat-associated protein